jgi:hypothetical protein
MGVGVHGVSEVRQMSTPSINDLPTLPADADDASLAQVLLWPVHRLAFWAAIVLPFLHLPLLVTGLETQTQTFAFVVLLACNAVALVVGHPAHTE